MNMIEKINTAKPGKEQAEEIVRQARIELRNHSGQWARLARISDGDLTYAWIQQFANGNIDMPHVDTIMTLAKFLGVRFKAEAGEHYNRFGG